MKNRVFGERKKPEKFIIALALVSVYGFLVILWKSIFGFDLNIYTDFALMTIVGIALLIDADYRILKTLKNGLNSNNFTHLIVAIIGFIAVLAGIFSLPQIFFDHPMFSSIKGIVALIAIIVIIVQTWFGSPKMNNKY